MELFSTRSPVERENTGGEKLSAPTLTGPAASRRFSSLVARLKPLLKARKMVNKVHSEGYFENHYPEADKTMKGLLSDQVMAAWARMQDDYDEPEEKGNGGVTIIINN